MKKRTPLAILAIAGLGVGSAHAANSVEPLFSAFPNPTLISDDSGEFLIDVDGSGTVSVNDILFGIVGYNRVGPTAIGQATTYNEITGIQANKISSGPNFIRPNGQGLLIADYDAVPLSAADSVYFDWSTGNIDVNMDGMVDFTFNTGLGAVNDDKTFILLFEDGNQNYNRDGTIQQGLDTATDTGGTNSGARMLVTLDAAVDGNDKIQVTSVIDPIAAIGALPSSTSIAGSSLFVDGTIANQNWQSLTVGQQITAGTGGFSTPSVASQWPIFDNQDTTFFVEQVPEPGTIALLAAGLMATGGFASGRRKRKQS